MNELDEFVDYVSETLIPLTCRELEVMVCNMPWLLDAYRKGLSAADATARILDAYAEAFRGIE